MSADVVDVADLDDLEDLDDLLASSAMLTLSDGAVMLMAVLAYKNESIRWMLCCAWWYFEGLPITTEVIRFDASMNLLVAID